MVQMLPSAEDGGISKHDDDKIRHDNDEILEIAPRGLYSISRRQRRQRQRQRQRHRQRRNRGPSY